MAGRRHRVLGIGTTLLLTGFAAACGGGGDSGGGTGTEGAIRYGFDFELNLTDTFDPQQSLSTCDRLALEWIYGTLTVLDETGQPQPGLADSWELDDEAGTFTLELHPGLEFSDGTAYDAEAVAAGLNYLKTGEQTGEELVSMVDAEAIDEDTVQLNLDGPGFSFPYNLAGRAGMIPAPSTYDIDDPEAGSAGTDPIGAGPFAFVSFSPGESIVLERNESYGGSEEYGFDNLELTQVGVGNPAVTALAAGDVDVIGYEAESQQAIDADSTLDSNSRVGEVYAQVQFRLDPPFDDVRIRQAVNYAIDRQAYIDVVQNGVGEIAWMPYPEASPNYNPDVAGVYERDLARARELLAEANVPDGFEFDLAIPGGVTSQERQAQLIQSQLAEVGITANIVPLGTDIATEYYLQHNGNAFSAARPASPDPVGQVQGQWANFQFVAINNNAERQDLTDLVEEAQLAATDEERAEIMQEAMVIIVEEALEVPIAFTPRNVAWSSERIEGDIGAPAEICDPVDLQGVSLR
jgi:peptide/nickel transport system substrate-binding protein